MHKKFILAVQGEGRGHMTQALSMYDMLIEQGHTVCAVIVGTSSRREIPAFFLEKIASPVYRIQSPNFVSDRKNKSINIARTITYNLARLKTFRQSLHQIDSIIKEHSPDIVVNFFDLLIGLYYRFYKPIPRLVCIAHQYIYFHPDFEFPKGHWIEQRAIIFYTRLTTSHKAKNLALSFYRIHTSNKNVTVVPPLLRKEVFNLQPRKDDFYLIYLVNNGYFEEVLEWHRSNPQIEIHCFTDQPEIIESQYNFNHAKLQLHAINDRLFLEMMSRARGLASTAGFESVCEAMFLGKPVLMVPVRGHFEQFCNAHDAFKAGAGIFDDKFDIGKLANFSATFNGTNQWFQNWVANAKLRIYNEIVGA